MMAENTPGPIFLLASGQRCGSTLLQRFLCSHPDILIWGEHDGTLGGIFTHFDRMMRWEEMFRHHYETYINDGYNNFIATMMPPQADLENAQRQLILNLFQVPAQKLGKSVWGFKEVLYEADMVFRLKALFPSAKFIYLTRNIFECFISLRHEEKVAPEDQPHIAVEQVWTRARTIQFIGDWVRVNKSFLDTPGLDQPWLYRLTYEQLTGNKDEETQKLADWLGLDRADFDMEIFRDKIYSDLYQRGKPDPRPKVTRADLSEEEVALVTTPEIMRISEQVGFDMSIR